MTFREGDYFYMEDAHNAPTPYSVAYCLRMDGDVAHVTIFQPIGNKPTQSDLPALEPQIAHCPVQADGFGDHVVFAHKPVEAQDLEGFYTFLKMTDFQRYIDETGENPEAIIQTAQDHYNRGNDLCDQKKFRDAITEYRAALDAFPLFFEAADNMGFAYMDMGDFESAIPCFEESIYVNGETFLAVFSIGECLVKLNDMQAARECFDRAGKLPSATPDDLRLLKDFLKNL